MMCSVCEFFRLDDLLLVHRGVTDSADGIVVPYCFDTLSVIGHPYEDSIYIKHCWTRKVPKQLTLDFEF